MKKKITLIRFQLFSKSTYLTIVLLLFSRSSFRPVKIINIDNY